ncbi:hypothetical protein [Paenibacillus sp. Soil766]|uniref:hypothetical protein n=1 Tax=Paenibacillus sp. Soil766 TaxID=1736404 RepID=UPI000AAF5F38|nr:hypothetical protein [Paenibacillus sp. Soil766]
MAAVAGTEAAGTEGAELLYNIFHKSGMLHASLHKVLGNSLSQISTGLCPHIPSSYLSKVWSPINVNGTGLCPKA